MQRTKGYQAFGEFMETRVLRIDAQTNQLVGKSLSARGSFSLQSWKKICIRKNLDRLWNSWS